MKQSSTWRKLHCVSFSLKSFAHLLSACSVKWFTDNQAIPLIVDSGCMKQHLHQLAVDIFHNVRENNIEIEAEWIPRSLNEKADYLSKIVDCDDWKAKDCYFHSANSYWGPCSVDYFASYKNHKVPRFYSKFFNLDSLGVDSLAFSRVGKFCWLVPPVSFVKNVIRHVCFCQSRGTLVIPYWPSVPFWPFLVERRGFSDYLSLIFSLLRPAKMFISMGQIIVPFLAQRILVPQCFFCCLTELYSACAVSCGICL